VHDLLWVPEKATPEAPPIGGAFLHKSAQFLTKTFAFL
jgi:hypothetical protein